MKNGDRVAYYGNGKGFWLRREWKPQCPARVFFYGRCQGVKGHKDAHWCYSSSGDFQWEDNDEDPRHGGCAGSIPPGNKDYVSPVKMQKHYYMSHYTDTEVTDKAALAMLDKDETPEKGASIDKPVRDKAALAMLKKDRILDRRALNSRPYAIRKRKRHR